MPDTRRMSRRGAPRCALAWEPSGRPAVADLPDVLTRKEGLRLLRGATTPGIRKAAGYRLYPDIVVPEVLESFLDTLLYDPSPGLRRFAAALLAYPALKGDARVERCLRHAVEMDADPGVRSRAALALCQLIVRGGDDG